MSHSSFMYYWGASSGHVFSTWEGQNNFTVSFLNNGQAYNGDIFPNYGRKSEDLNLAYDLLFQGIVQFVSDLLATSPTPCPTLMLHLFCCPYYQHWCYNNCTLFPWIKLWILEMIHHFFWRHVYSILSEFKLGLESISQWLYRLSLYYRMLSSHQMDAEGGNVPNLGKVIARDLDASDPPHERVGDWCLCIGSLHPFSNRHQFHWSKRRLSCILFFFYFHDWGWLSYSLHLGSMIGFLICLNLSLCSILQHSPSGGSGGVLLPCWLFEWKGKQTRGSC